MWAAQQAVRRLEQRNVSIQDVVIADRNQRTWRKLRGGDGQFLVVMIADRPEIERARALFRSDAHGEERA
jgi:hypothetical protein